MEESKATEVTETGGTATETGGVGNAAPVVLDKTPDTGATAARPDNAVVDVSDLVWEEDEPIYPEGYDPENPDANFFSPGDEDVLGVLRKNPDVPEQPAPDGQPAEMPGQAAPESNAAADASAKAKPNTPESPVADKAEDADYKALWEAAQEEKNKAEYRRIFKEQTDKLMTPEAARMIAAAAVGGKEYPLEDAPEESVTANPPDRVPGPAAFAADLEQISRLYPDAAESGLPKEVLQAYKSGTPLLNAYAAHRAKSDAAAIQTLRAEIAGLRQNQRNRDSAVVRGTTGGTPVNEPDDPFLRGMREESW